MQRQHHQGRLRVATPPGSPRPSWKKRFCVASPRAGALFAFKGVPVGKNPKFKTQIELRRTRVYVKLVDSRSRKTARQSSGPHCFAILDGSGLEHLFVADSAADMKHWVSTLEPYTEYFQDQQKQDQGTSSTGESPKVKGHAREPSGDKRTGSDHATAKPTNKAQEKPSLPLPFFHDDITALQAIEILKNQKRNSFLLRPSSSSDEPRIVVSFVGSQGIGHLLIDRTLLERLDLSGELSLVAAPTIRLVLKRLHELGRIKFAVDRTERSASAPPIQSAAKEPAVAREPVKEQHVQMQSRKDAVASASAPPYVISARASEPSSNNKRPIGGPGIDLASANQRQRAESAPPLPFGWELRINPKSGRYYFIDHGARRTTYRDPRTGQNTQKDGRPPFSSDIQLVVSQGEKGPSLHQALVPSAVSPPAAAAPVLPPATAPPLMSAETCTNLTPLVASAPPASFTLELGSGLREVPGNSDEQRLIMERMAIAAAVVEKDPNVKLSGGKNGPTSPHEQPKSAAQAHERPAIPSVKCSSSSASDAGSESDADDSLEDDGNGGKQNSKPSQPPPLESLARLRERDETLAREIRAQKLECVRLKRAGERDSAVALLRKIQEGEKVLERLRREIDEREETETSHSESSSDCARLNDNPAQTPLGGSNKLSSAYSTSDGSSSGNDESDSSTNSSDNDTAIGADIFKPGNQVGHLASEAAERAAMKPASGSGNNNAVLFHSATGANSNDRESDEDAIPEFAASKGDDSEEERKPPPIPTTPVPGSIADRPKRARASISKRQSRRERTQASLRYAREKMEERVADELRRQEEEIRKRIQADLEAEIEAILAGEIDSSSDETEESSSTDEESSETYGAGDEESEQQQRLRQEEFSGKTGLKRQDPSLESIDISLMPEERPAKRKSDYNQKPRNTAGTTLGKGDIRRLLDEAGVAVNANESRTVMVRQLLDHMRRTQ